MYLDDVQHHHAQSPWGSAAEAMSAAGMAVPQIMYLFNYKPERTRFLAINFYTTWVDGSGVQDLPDYTASGERMAANGYIQAEPK